jgi:hypothetical protein
MPIGEHEFHHAGAGVAYQYRRVIYFFKVYKLWA